MACGSCAGRRGVLRGGRTATVTSTTTCKVTYLDGRCALATDDGLCRVFSDQASALAAARAELGSTGWTIQPVQL